MLLATPLHVAAYYGSLDAVKALLDFKAKVPSTLLLSSLELSDTQVYEP